MKPTEPPSEPRLRELFLAALDIADPTERERYLSKACGPDTALRLQLLSLLAQNKDDSFLEQPPTEIIELADLSETDPRSGASAQPAEALGDHIGPFKLLQLLGEGGCGTVYMAEQSEPVRRKVALKVIKLGMDTRSVIARFEAERQALAMMDHPNIARVLDAGSTASGRPYFVMELVRGVPITKYCDENNLPTSERLELFTKVCQAIQHAHQKGIIHRDIKPSNILVTLHDGVPVPKVIDFGIAKATNQVLTEKTLFTELHAFMGTPAYTSPEQAEMSGLDIDTRADIYSLGVLLYELLTGRLPFSPDQLLKAGLDEMRRTIREVEPPRPSTRLSTLTGEDVSTIAKRRGTEPSKLSSLLRGDLDWIVMKALEKDRTRRYESASAFADDIRRHLESEAVIARPPSTAYLLGRLMRRHKLPFAAVSAVIAALGIGIAVASWHAVQAKASEKAARESEEVALKAKRKAELAEAKARTEAERVKQTQAFLVRTLNELASASSFHKDKAVMLDVLSSAKQRVKEELKGDPATASSLLNELAGLYCGLGDTKTGEAIFQESIDLQRRQPTPNRQLIATSFLTMSSRLMHRRVESPDMIKVRDLAQSVLTELQLPMTNAAHLNDLDTDLICEAHSRIAIAERELGNYRASASAYGEIWRRAITEGAALKSDLQFLATKYAESLEKSEQNEEADRVWMTAIHPPDGINTRFSRPHSGIYGLYVEFLLRHQKFTRCLEVLTEGVDASVKNRKGKDGWLHVSRQVTLVVGASHLARRTFKSDPALSRAAARQAMKLTEAKLPPYLKGFCELTLAGFDDSLTQEILRNHVQQAELSIRELLKTHRQTGISPSDWRDVPVGEYFELLMDVVNRLEGGSPQANRLSGLGEEVEYHNQYLAQLWSSYTTGPEGMAAALRSREIAAKYFGTNSMIYAASLANLAGHLAGSGKVNEQEDCLVEARLVAVKGMPQSSEILSTIERDLDQCIRRNGGMAQTRGGREFLEQMKTDSGKSSTALANCAANMRQLDGASRQWQLESRKSMEDTPVEFQVSVYLKGGVIPLCQSGGHYTLGKVKDDPSCSIHGSLGSAIKRLKEQEAK